MPTCLRPGRKEEEKKKKKKEPARRWRSRALEGETEAFHRAGKEDRGGVERRGEEKPGRNRRSCRRIVARTALQCHLLSAPDDSPRSPENAGAPSGPRSPFLGFACFI